MNTTPECPAAPTNKDKTSRQVEDIYALSPIQKEIFLHPGPTAVQQRLRYVYGPLDLPILEQAWVETAARHPLLRTSFRQTHKQVVQVVIGPDNSPFSFTVHDLRYKLSEEIHATIQQAINEDAQVPFDLKNGPLWRLTIFRMSEVSFETLLTFHQIVLDESSAHLIESEVWDLYFAKRYDGDFPAKERTLHFKDYIVWLQKQAIPEAEKYWAQYLDAVVTPAFLPLDHNATAKRLSKLKTIDIADQTMAPLYEWAHDHNLPITSVLEAGWALVLAKHLGQNEIVFGSGISGRPPHLPDSDRIVGPFANIVPVRAMLRPDATIGEMVDAVHLQTIQSNSYGHLPLAQIQDQGPVRQPDWLFDTAFLSRSLERECERRYELWLCPGKYEAATSSPGCPLVAEFVQRRNCSLTITYDERLLTASVIDDLLLTFQGVLKSMANFDASLSEFGVAADARRGGTHDASTPASTQASNAPFVAPQTELERQLAEIWKEVLGLERVGRHDDFFDLGGQSLTTIRIRSRIAERLGIDIKLKTIFEHTTLDSQAKAVAEHVQSTQFKANQIPLLGDLSSYAVSHAQSRLWFLQRLDPEDRWYHTADCVLLEGPLDRSAFEQSVHWLFERHASLRTRFTLLEGGPVQQISPDANVPIPYHDLSRLTETERRAQTKRLVDDVPKCFSNLESPPVQALLIKQADDKHLFVLAVHHILSDGWSGQIVLRDLVELYAAACQKRQSALPALRVRYVDYAAWHNKKIEQGKLAESERYWLNRLGGDLPKLQLPLNDLRAAKTGKNLGSETVETGAEVTRQLGLIAEACECTPFMVKLALFKAFLAKITGQHDILVASNSGGREHVDIEPLVGLFVNFIVLRTDVGEAPCFTNLLQRVKQTCVEAYAHQDYPFDLLVQRLAPERNSEQMPFLQAVFAEVPHADPQTAEGVRFTGVDLDSETQADLAGRTLPEGLGLMCKEDPDGGLTWRFIFRSGLFAEGATRRWARQFGAFVTAVASQPEKPIVEIEVADFSEAKLQPVEKREHYPISFNQRDMWFQREIYAEASLNNILESFEITGPLRVDLWRHAVQMIVNRHDALRAEFLEIKGVPFQHIAVDVPVSFPLIDLSDRPFAEHDSLVQARSQALVAQPFDFAHAPLFRAELVRLAENRHIFIFAVHHLISDGVYTSRFLEQVGKSYEMLLAGGDGKLQPLPVQSSDIAVWEGERLQKGNLALHGPYWRKQLQAPLPGMLLPTERDSHLVGSFQAGCVEWQVPPEVLQGLRRTQKSQSVTIFRIVMAAFAVVLQRVVREKELLLGCAFSLAPKHPSDLIGFFAHVLPLRFTVDPSQSFTHNLAKINAHLTEAEKHVQYPLYEAVTGLKADRGPRQPLLPVLISQIKDADMDAGDIHINYKSAIVYGGVYHLWLALLKKKKSLQLIFFYNKELLEGWPIQLMTSYMKEALAQVAAHPELPVGDLKLLSSVEEQRVLKLGTTDTPAAIKKEEGVVTRIARQARKRPQAVAVRSGSEELNYSVLNARANRFARWLRKQGVGPEQKIGVFGARSPEMLITILGALKAGAAFVPLDPLQPDVRLRGILRQAELKMLTCDADQISRAQELVASLSSSPTVVCWHEVASFPDVPNPKTWRHQLPWNPAPIDQLQDLAYVFYTSGSTGTPKGAMVEHQGMLNHLLAKIDFLGLNEESIVAQNASHCFDISVWQFLAALMVGGQIVIYPQETLLKPGSLLKQADHDGITVLETVPSLLELMLKELPDVKLAQLKYLVSNAETLPVPLARRWCERFPNTALVNTYGATEASDDVTHQIVDDLTDSTPRVPVGKPISGARIYILDERLQLLPAGCVGQIAIAGNVVGRGYLGDVETTGRVFIPSPFGDFQQRLYLTGDLGRWNSKGELEFIGRMDTQVKMNGQRIELGEIEATLAKCPGIRQVAVVLKQDDHSQRLVAFWVGGPTVTNAKLRAYAQQQLPSHMAPNTCVELQTMPLTPNGKIDRLSLPQPDNSTDSVMFVPPRDEIEFKMTRLWEDELGVQGISVYDNFFERGGHSLKAVSLLGRLQTEFNVALPLRTLFDFQTVESLSQVVRKSTVDKPPLAASSLVRLQAGDSSHAPLFLIHPHGGTVFCYQALVEALGPEFPVFGIQCRGLEQDEQPMSSFSLMAAEYVKEIRSAQPHGPYRIAGWSLGGMLAFEVVRQLEANSLDVTFLGVFDSALPDEGHSNLEFLLPKSASITPEEFNVDMSIGAFARWFLQADKQQLKDLTEEQAVERLKEFAQRAGMLPPDVSPAMLRRFANVAISSAVAMFQYRPAGKVQTDVRLFRATNTLVPDPSIWIPWTEGTVHTCQVPGSHYDMVFPPTAKVLGELVRKELAVSNNSEATYESSGAQRA